MCFRANYLGIRSPFFGNATAPLLAVTSDYKRRAYLRRLLAAR
jgi:hypothetical protein